MARRSHRESSSALARDTSGLPRRDSAIVVGVTAAIVGLIVLWMSQAAAVAEHTSTAPEESAPGPSLLVVGDER